MNHIECLKSEMEIFLPPPSQNTYEDSYTVEYRPVQTINETSGPIQFSITPSPYSYTDLSQTYLYLECRITQKGNLDLTADNNVAMLNYGLHSMFSELDVRFNNKKVGSTGSNYAYRSIIEATLNYGTDAKNSHLQSSGYYKDEAGKMDSPDNSGFTIRLHSAKLSRTINFFGRLHGDVFNMSRLVKDDVNITIKLERNKNQFILMSDSKSEYELRVVNPVLVVRKVKIKPSILQAHALAIQKQPAKYPVTTVEVTSHTLTKGAREVSIDNLCPTALPNRVVIGFVDSDAYSGALNKNPYNFQHFDITEISLAVDNNDVAYSPLELDFKNNKYTRAYYSLFIGLDRGGLDIGNSISLTEYANGYTLFAFDLSPDKTNGEIFNLLKRGNLRLKVKFGTQLGDAKMCIIYTETDHLILIHKDSQVEII